MLDLIIPVYKDKKRLYSTLMSIGNYVSDLVYVTIVDDCSGEDYSDVVETFQRCFPIRVIYLKENSGPGIARQVGINNAKQEYISFMDCGDIYVEPNSLKKMLDFVKENPQYNMYCWSHADEITGNGVFANNNRIHAKIYKRDFLEKNNITFCAESSRANEDIGFNHACRMINYEISKNTNTQTIYNNDEIMVLWKNDDKNSLTRRNNCAFYYKEQNLGLAAAMKHAFEIVENAGVDEYIIANEVYKVMAHIYCFYLSTINRRPEFTQEALAGAVLFYKNSFKKYGHIDPELFRKNYYDTLITLLSEDDSPICDKIVHIDIIEFLNMLEKLCK